MGTKCTYRSKPARKDGALAPPGNFSERASPLKDAQVATNCAVSISFGEQDNSILDELSKLEMIDFDDSGSALYSDDDSDEDSIQTQFSS